MSETERGAVKGVPEAAVKVRPKSQRPLCFHVASAFHSWGRSCEAGKVCPVA